MTDAQKLEALLNEGVKRGWNGQGCGFDWEHDGKYGDTRRKTIEWLLHWDAVWMATLYRHDFARALFGEEQIIFTHRDFKLGKTLGDNALPTYLYHLQQAVILPTPSEQIDYMYKAVFNG